MYPQVVGVNTLSCLLYLLLDSNFDGQGGQANSSQDAQSSQHQHPGAAGQARTQGRQIPGIGPSTSAPKQDQLNTDSSSASLSTEGSSLNQACVPNFQALALQSMLSRGFGANLPPHVLHYVAAGPKRYGRTPSPYLRSLLSPTTHLCLRPYTFLCMHRGV
jgi:hypothetical protein